LTRSKVRKGVSYHYVVFCGFGSKQELDKHSADSYPNNFEQTQKPRKKHTIVSQECTERSKQLSEHAELTRSKVMKNDERASHMCEECGKVFSRLYNLLRHRNIHANMRPYICQYSVCNKGFRTRFDLNRHVRHMHDGVKNFACDVCSRHFARSTAKDKHKRTHSNKRLNLCNTCSKSFKQLEALRVHRLDHSQIRPYRYIVFCGFRSKQELDKHATDFHPNNSEQTQKP